MTAAQVLSDLADLGVHVAAIGDRLRYTPKSAVPAEWVERMRTHKQELLAMLSGDDSEPVTDVSDAKSVWNAALDQLDNSPLFPPEVIDTLRAAEAEWAGADDDCDFDFVPVQDEVTLGPDGWPVNSIDPDELTPCPTCGSLELWESLADNPLGRTPGRWRCMKCDPPRSL